MYGCSWHIYLVNLSHYNSQWIKRHDDNCENKTDKPENNWTSEPLRVGTNQYQQIELEQKSQTVLKFSSPEYVNAFLEQVSIGNHTPQRKSNSANIYVCESEVCERMKLLNFKRNTNWLEMVERVNKTGPEWWFRNVHAKQVEVKTIHENNGYFSTYR